MSIASPRNQLNNTLVKLLIGQFSNCRPQPIYCSDSIVSVLSIFHLEVDIVIELLNLAHCLR